MKRKTARRITVIVLSLIFSVYLVPLSAWAEICGDFNVDGGAAGLDFNFTTDSGGLLSILSGTELVISNVDPNTATTNRIEIDSAEANITLNNVNIDCSSKPREALRIWDDANANITLQGTNTLKSGDGSAGLEVQENASLVITAESTGSLEASGGEMAAGIGGSESDSSGKIRIDGGDVKAIGGFAAAGIGGGLGGSGTEIEINGGKVYAQGGAVGAGIGGGAIGNSGKIAIKGGDVTAIGGDGGEQLGSPSGNGAGIGRGGGVTSYDDVQVGEYSDPDISPDAEVFARPGSDENGGGKALGEGGIYGEGTPGKPFEQTHDNKPADVVVMDAGESLGSYITVTAGDVSVALSYTIENGVVKLSSPDDATLERLLASGADTLNIDLSSVSGAEKLVIPESIVGGSISTVVAVFAERTVSVAASELSENGYVLENK